MRRAGAEFIQGDYEMNIELAERVAGHILEQLDKAGTLPAWGDKQIAGLRNFMVGEIVQCRTPAQLRFVLHQHGGSPEQVASAVEVAFPKFTPGMKQYALFICHQGTFSITRKEIIMGWTPEDAVEKANLATIEEPWVYTVDDKPIRWPKWVGRNAAE
jgi:hypothetical protein